MGTSFQRNYFWNCLGEQALALIGWWYPKAMSNQSFLILFTQTIPGIFAWKSCTHSPVIYRVTI